jgi:hypothetical protein
MSSQEWKDSGATIMNDILNGIRISYGMGLIDKEKVKCHIEGLKRTFFLKTKSAPDVLYVSRSTLNQLIAIFNVSPVELCGLHVYEVKNLDCSMKVDLSGENILEETT